MRMRSGVCSVICTLILCLSLGNAHDSVVRSTDSRTFSGDTTGLPIPQDGSPFIFEFPLIKPEVYLPVVDAEQGLDWKFTSSGESSCIAKICVHSYSPLPKRTIVVTPGGPDTPVVTVDVAPSLSTWDNYCSLVSDIPELTPNADPVTFKLYPSPGPAYVTVGIAPESTGCKFELSYTAALECKEGEYGNKCQEKLSEFGSDPIEIRPNESALFLAAPEGNTIVGAVLRIKADNAFSLYTFENSAPSTSLAKGYDFTNTTTADQFEMVTPLSGIRYLNTTSVTTATSSIARKRYFGTYIRIHNPSDTKTLKLIQASLQLNRCQTHSTGSMCGLNIGQVMATKYARNPNFACCDDGVNFGIYYGSLSAQDIAEAQSKKKKKHQQLGQSGSASPLLALVSQSRSQSHIDAPTAADDDQTWSFGLAIAGTTQLPAKDFPSIYLRRGNIPLLDDSIAPFKRGISNPFLWVLPGSHRKGYDMRVDTPSEISRFFSQTLIAADKSDKTGNSLNGDVAEDNSGVVWYYMIIVNPSTHTDASLTKMSLLPTEFVTQDSPDDGGSSNNSSDITPYTSNGLRLVTWGGSKCPSSCSDRGDCGTNEDPHRCVCDKKYTKFPDCSVEPVPPPPHTPSGPSPFYLQFWFIMVCVVAGLMTGLVLALLYMRYKKRERFLAFFDASTVDYLAKESKADVKKGYLSLDDTNQLPTSSSATKLPTASVVVTTNVPNENAPLLVTTVPGQPKKDAKAYGGIESTTARAISRPSLGSTPVGSNLASATPIPVASVPTTDTKFVRPTHIRIGSATTTAASLVAGVSAANHSEYLSEIDSPDHMGRAQIGSFASSHFSLHDGRASGLEAPAEPVVEAIGRPSTPNANEFGDLIRIGVVGGERAAENVAQFEEDTEALGSSLAKGQKWTMGTL